MQGLIPEGINPNLVFLTGAIVTWWGRCESMLISELTSLRQHPLCADLKRKEPFPVSTSRLIDHWARARSLAYVSNSLRLKGTAQLKPELIACSALRNKLCHGAWPYETAAPDAPLRLWLLKPKKGTHDDVWLDIYETDQAGLEALNSRLIRLYHRLLAETLWMGREPDPAPTTATGETAATRKTDRRV